jgi:xanthine dehydrogenase YagR molybdenum-binding subunit
MSLGEGQSRIDGRDKVSGRARYAAEVAAKCMHAVLVESTIAKGRITTMDTATAEASSGVLLVLTHLNAPRLPGLRDHKKSLERFPLLQDSRVRYNGQHVALVVAETLEEAQYAAGLVRIRYQEETPVTRLEEVLDRARSPKNFRGGSREPDSKRGDPEAALAECDITLDLTYRTPIENHNPMEPHAVVASWDKQGTLTVHHSTQAVFDSRSSIAALLGLKEERVHVVSTFVGGGFGSKGPAWPHLVLAAQAARIIGKPVKLAVTRRQMYANTGHRSQTIQRVRIGAGKDGRLKALRHDSILANSTYAEFTESCGLASEVLYSCPNLAVTHRIADLDAATPSYMRAPGEASGSFALECAMDELAYATGLDPIDLRLLNHADRNEHTGKPWSSKSLKECYAQGAEAFGWSSRSAAPRSMRRGDLLVGWGMASAVYPAERDTAEARVRIKADGTAEVLCGSQDIGTGTYTIMAQTAAEILGLAVEKVTAKLGDSALPRSPISGGSQTAASITPAIALASRRLVQKLTALAVQGEDAPLRGAANEEIEAVEGSLRVKREPARMVSFADLLAHTGQDNVEAEGKEEPGSETDRFSLHAFGAHFVEVRVDPLLGEVRIGRYVGAFAAGRILNPKTARSQAIGGIVFGLGMALGEETCLDPRTGRILNANLTDYLVPVHADVPDIRVLLVAEDDPHVNPLGVKGIGELPTVGAAAAVANAVFHATGHRLRGLPIRLESLLNAA